MDKNRIKKDLVGQIGDLSCVPIYALIMPKFWIPSNNIRG